MISATDAIEKQVDLAAPPARVWRALTDHREFNAWFRVALESPFAVGQRTRGPISCTGKDLVMEVEVVELDAQRMRFAWRWHPYAVDAQVDYGSEPTTLVTFTLTAIPGGTRLRIVESGFDALPPGRRDLALRMNTQGWDGKAAGLVAHVSAG